MKQTWWISSQTRFTFVLLDYWHVCGLYERSKCPAILRLFWAIRKSGVLVSFFRKQDTMPKTFSKFRAARTLFVYARSNFTWRRSNPRSLRANSYRSGEFCISTCVFRFGFEVKECVFCTLEYLLYNRIYRQGKFKKYILCNSDNIFFIFKYRLLLLINCQLFYVL